MTDDGTMSLPCPGCGDSHEPFQHRTGCAFGGEILSIEPAGIDDDPGQVVIRAHGGPANEGDRVANALRKISNEYQRPRPGPPNVYPMSDRTQIATAALSGILARVDGKLPVQAGDMDRFVAGAASLAVKAADALIKELRHQEVSRNNRSESP